MNIGLCHFRIGETDGVSLEMDKWNTILEKLGHHVIYIAGSKGSLSNVKIIEELHYNDANNNKIVANAYGSFSDFETKASFKKFIEKDADSIEKKLITIIHENNLDLIIVNNMFSLGWNIPAAIGVFKAIKNSSVKCLCHHHDFHWEREKYSHPTKPFISDYLNEFFPPNHERISHVVINSIAKKELLKRRNIKSTIVSNVFNFDNNWVIDDYNSDFRSTFQIKQDDVIVLQATRIVKRKGIELAIDFVDELTKNKHNLIGKKLYNNQVFNDKSNIVFLMVGLNEDEPYFNKIMDYANKKQIHIKWINEKIEHDRALRNNQKIYSLWDAYANCNIVTYTSLLEGWGNQFIEALVAKKIIISYQYPVFVQDILPLKFNTIDLGSNYIEKDDGLAKVNSAIIDNAVKSTINILLNSKEYTKIVEENYQKGKQNLSLDTLEKLLKSIIND